MLPPLLPLFIEVREMKNNYCVYKHTSPSGKVYIGITSANPERRWKNGEGYKTQMFYRAITKYGWASFKHEILNTNLTKEEAEQKEIELIKEYNSTNSKYGYNVDNGGNTVGTHSEITRQKMSEYMIGDTRNNGRIHTEKSRNNMSKAHIGNKLTDETKRKLSEFNTGKKYNDETKERIKIAKRKSQGSPVYCVELDINFNSIPEAVEYVNNIGGSVIRQGIQKVLNGTMNTSGKLVDGTKLHWKFIDR